jgi:ABC-type transport system involved in multi-copper enzyme maturation permease subunit
MMRRVLAIAASVMADSARRKVMYAVLALAAVMMLAIPALPSYGAGIVKAIFREVSLAVMYAMAMLVVLVLAANRIPGEVERRTVYNVLSKPVARWQYLLGTWLGIWAVMGVLLVAFLVVDLAFGAVVYREFMWRLAEGAFGIWLESGVVAAAAVALSARFGPVTVVIGALALIFVGHSKSGLFGEAPQGMVAALYPSLDTFTIINPVAHGNGVGPVTLALMSLAFVGWSVVLLAIGVLAFQGRDL